MTGEQNVTKQLDTGWRVVLVIWGAILASLGVYLFVCIYFEKFLKINSNLEFPIEKLKYSLFGISCITLFLAHYLRKYLMRPNSTVANLMKMSSPQHPAVARYTMAVVITSALLESIGIYGVVLFLMSKDALLLYQFLIISAAAMVYFRPRKEELLNMAKQMKEPKQN